MSCHQSSFFSNKNRVCPKFLIGRPQWPRALASRLLCFIRKLSPPPATTPTSEGFSAASDPVVKSPWPPSRFLSHPHHCRSKRQQLGCELQTAKPKPGPGNSAAAQRSPALPPPTSLLPLTSSPFSCPLVSWEPCSWPNNMLPNVIHGCREALRLQGRSSLTDCLHSQKGV